MKYLIIIFLFISCSTTRDVKLNKSTFESGTITTNNDVILKQETILNDIFTIKPFDNNKSMFLNGKEYKNVVITKDKTKHNVLIKTIFNRQTITKIIDITKTKEIKKTDYTSLFFILCLFVFLWFYLPKVRSYIRN